MDLLPSRLTRQQQVDTTGLEQVVSFRTKQFSAAENQRQILPNPVIVLAQNKLIICSFACLRQEKHLSNSDFATIKSFNRGSFFRIFWTCCFWFLGCYAIPMLKKTICCPESLWPNCSRSCGFWSTGPLSAAKQREQQWWYWYSQPSLKNIS